MSEIISNLIFAIALIISILMMKNLYKLHYVKIFQIRSYFWSVFSRNNSVFGHVSRSAAYDKLEKVLNETTSKSLLKKEKETKKPWVSNQSSYLIEQRPSARKRYPNHLNSENCNTWRNTAELADASLVNDKIKKLNKCVLKPMQPVRETILKNVST